MVFSSTRNEQPKPNFIGAPSKSFMPTVLIVEDDADNRELLKIMLGIWNYCVIEAKDGIEALSLARKARPDLILMDVKLPLLDGLETTRKIRNSAMISGTPVIFISGCAEPKYRAAANEVGADAYLVKPLDFDNLRAVVADQITRDRYH